mgnify:CR=1 FL=1
MEKASVEDSVDKQVKQATGLFTGLGVLIGALKRVRSHDGDLQLVCNEPRIARVFEITGLDQIFEIHETLDAAVVP